MGDDFMSENQRITLEQVAQVTTCSADDILKMYSLLNNVFSANYTCLRIQNQMSPLFFDANDTRKTVYGDGLDSFWLDKKLSACSKNRNDLIGHLDAVYRSMFNDPDLDREENLVKEYLIQEFNAYYGKNEKYEDVFDMFEIKDKQFNEDFFRIHLSAVFPEELTDMIALADAFYKYIDYMKDSVAVESWRDIFDALHDEVNPNGYKTAYLRNPTNEKVKLISIDEIEKIKNEAFAIFSEAEKQINVLNKDISALAKKHKRKPEDKQIASALATKQFDLTQAHTKHALACDLVNFVYVLADRIKATNKNYNQPKPDEIFEGVMDLASGINVFNKSNVLKLKNTYVHEQELKYLEFLMHSAKNFKMFKSEVVSEKSQN